MFPSEIKDQTELHDEYHLSNSLSVQGKVKNWFENLLAANMSIFPQFMQLFLGRWVIMGNVFFIIEDYGNLKIWPEETVQYFSARVNNKYHSMLADIRPPPGVALLQYPDALNPEVSSK